MIADAVLLWAIRRMNHTGHFFRRWGSRLSNWCYARADDLTDNYTKRRADARSADRE